MGIRISDRGNGAGVTVPMTLPIQWHLLPRLTFAEQIAKEREHAMERIALLQPYKDVGTVQRMVLAEIQRCNDMIAYCDRVSPQ